MTVFIFSAHTMTKMIVSLLEAIGIMMPVNGMCQMMWTGTCLSSGGQRMREAALTSSQWNNMSSLDEDDEDCESYEPTFKDAKEEFEHWIEFFVEYAEIENSHFKWKYKKGREPDVLAYLILEESEQRKIRN